MRNSIRAMMLAAESVGLQSSGSTPMTHLIGRGVRGGVTLLAMLAVLALPGVPSSRLAAQAAGAGTTQRAAANQNDQDRWESTIKKFEEADKVTPASAERHRLHRRLEHRAMESGERVSGARTAGDQPRLRRLVGGRLDALRGAHRDSVQAAHRRVLRGR